MNHQASKCRSVRGALLSSFPFVAFVILIAPDISAGDLNEVMSAGASKIQLARTSQKNIDAVVQQTQGLESEYKQIMKQVDGLKVYNDYMQRQIKNQLAELEALRHSIDEISVIERQIMPLMIRMLDALEQFIELDVPFVKVERLARVDGLEEIHEPSSF